MGDRDMSRQLTSGVLGRKKVEELFYMASTDGTGSGENQSWGLLLPLGKTMQIIWGDGDVTDVIGDGTLTVCTHTYAVSGSYDISFGGDYLYLTQLSCHTNNLTGDVSSWSALTNLTQLRCYTNNLTGDVSSWSALTNLTHLSCHTNNLTGDVSSWSALTKLTELRCNTNNLTGDVSSWSALTNLNHLRCHANNLTGDVSSWSALTNLTQLRCHTNNLTFDSVSFYGLNNSTILMYSTGFNSTHVNNALKSFAGDATTNITNSSIHLAGTNAVRTSDSDAAVADIEDPARGNSLTVNS